MAEREQGNTPKKKNHFYVNILVLGGLRKQGPRARASGRILHPSRLWTLWKKIEELKPKIDLMLEPSAGIGNFLEGCRKHKKS